MTLEIPDQATLTSLETVAIQVARNCGDLIRQRPDVVDVTDTKSSPVDIVTEMDRRSEELSRRLLAELRPDDALLGEEGMDVPGTSGITWIIDPVDGTVNYLYGQLSYCVSVAAVVGDAHVEGGWRPVAAAVYNPLLDELFHARAGGGSHFVAPRMRRELRFNGSQQLMTSLVGTGFGYAVERRTWQARLLLDIIPHIRDIRRLGSAAMDLCYVALGRIDAFYERGLNNWDIAGGWLVAEESGAVVRGVDTPYPTQNFTVVGRQNVVQELIALAAPHFE